MSTKNSNGALHTSKKELELDATPAIGQGNHVSASPVLALIAALDLSENV